MAEPPALTVREVDFYERPVPLRLPFRFGRATLTEARQVFVRVRVIVSGVDGEGQAAELLAAKWFDKDPALSNEQNYHQLRRSLAAARRLYLESDRPRTAFGLHAALEPQHYGECERRGLNRLIAGFGTALVDRAVLDALCRILALSVFEAVQLNIPGVDASTAPDLLEFPLGAFLAKLRPAQSIEARHTVGLVDALTEAEIDPADRVGDGLPESLEAAIAAYGHRYFKLKLSGDVAADVERLSRIAAVLDRIPDPYFVTLDGNEQFADAESVLALMRGIGGRPALARLMQAVLYIEQPIARATALSRPIHELAAARPVAIDESDSDIAVFPRAKGLGYAAISSKACKGIYRSLLNRARVAKWNAETPGKPYFMIAEDLSTQPGVAVQQDLALATLIGCSHVERNGHHYVDGMAGAPEAEQRRFLAAHPDLYHRADGRLRLSIRDGKLALGSLAAPGLGVGPMPDWTAMQATSDGD